MSTVLVWAHENSSTVSSGTTADGHDGWKTFEYRVDHDGGGLVAVGMNVVWGTDAFVVLDNVVLS
jgi:hypothetical protein